MPSDPDELNSSLTRPRRRSLRYKIHRRAARSWRTLFPRASQRTPAARDLVLDAEELAAARSAVVTNAVSYVPIIGLMLVTINLFVQAHGNAGVAIAIAQNLSLGALTLTVLLNLVTYFMYGILIALVPIILDTEYSLGIRRASASVVFVLCIVMLQVIPLVFYIAIILVIFLSRYAGWRLELRSDSRSTSTGSSMEQLFRSAEPPVDVDLREIWMQGRIMLRAVGASLKSLPIEEQYTSTKVPRSIEDLRLAWNARIDEIRRPNRKNITTVAFTAIVAFISAYGLTIVINPIRFAPLSSVEIDRGDPEVGYLLIGDTGSGVFLPRTGASVRFLDENDVVKSTMCAPSRSVWSSPLATLNEKAAPGTVNC